MNQDKLKRHYEDNSPPPTQDEYEKAACWLYNKNLVTNQLLRNMSSEPIDINVPQQSGVTSYESPVQKIFGESLYNLEPEIVRLFLDGIDQCIQQRMFNNSFLSRNFKGNMTKGENALDIHARGIAIPETRLHKLLLFALNQPGMNFMCDFYTLYIPDQSKSIASDTTIYVADALVSANDSQPSEIVRLLLSGINPPASWVSLKLESEH